MIYFEFRNTFENSNIFIPQLHTKIRIRPITRIKISTEAINTIPQIFMNTLRRYRNSIAESQNYPHQSPLKEEISEDGRPLKASNIFETSADTNQNLERDQSINSYITPEQEDEKAPHSSHPKGPFVCSSANQLKVSTVCIL